MKILPVLLGAAVALPVFSQNADACDRRDRDRVKVRSACHKVHAGYYRTAHRDCDRRVHRGYYRDWDRRAYRDRDWDRRDRRGRPFLAGAITGAAVTAAVTDGYGYRHHYRNRGWGHRGYYGGGYYGRGYYGRGYSPHYYRSGFYGPRVGFGVGFGRGLWW